MADLGLIWYSTIGVEMTALGRPVIRAGASWLADCDFFMTAGDPAAYIVALEAARQSPQRATMDQVAGAWRFTYMWYFRQTIAFPLVTQPTWFQGEPAYKTPDALAPGKDSGLDHICDVIMNGAPLYPEAARRPADMVKDESSMISDRIAPYRTTVHAAP